MYKLEITRVTPVNESLSQFEHYMYELEITT